MAQAGAAPPPLQPGQQPTQAQIEVIQAQFLAEAHKRGLTPQQFRELLIQQQQAMQAQQAAQQGQQDSAGLAEDPGQTQVPIQPGPPKPEAIALANFLKSQPLKARECILMGQAGPQRKELFKGTIRAVDLCPSTITI